MSKKSVAVVTGANSDLGLPIVRELLKSGYFVWGHFNSNPAVLEEIQSDEFRKLKADLTRPAEAKAVFEEISTIHSGIDLLINMVGPFEMKPIEDFTPEAWEKTIQLNLNTAFNSIYFARPMLMPGISQVINFTYAGAENIRALPQATAYAAAKAGLAVLTKSLASELGTKGIRVNAVAPGWIDHPGFTDQKRADIQAQVPMGRPGTTDEVVSVVKWLAQGAPSYVNGATIAVAGGWEF